MFFIRKIIIFLSRLYFYQSNKLKNPPKNFVNILNQKNILLSGSSSGIGKKILEQMLKSNCKSIYCIDRNPLIGNYPNDKRISIINLDLVDYDKFEYEKLISSNTEIDIFISCAATILPKKQSIEDFNFNDLIKVLRINSISYFHIVKNLSNFKSKKNELICLAISSHIGSIKKNTTGGMYFYRLSKNLLNCISKNLSIDLKNYNVFSFSIDPGDVKTGINQLGVLDTDYVSKKILESLIDYKRNNGKFINLFGNELET